MRNQILSKVDKTISGELHEQKPIELNVTINNTDKDGEEMQMSSVPDLTLLGISRHYSW